MKPDMKPIPTKNQGTPQTNTKRPKASETKDVNGAVAGMAQRRRLNAALRGTKNQKKLNMIRQKRTRRARTARDIGRAFDIRLLTTRLSGAGEAVRGGTTHILLRTLHALHFILPRRSNR